MAGQPTPPKCTPLRNKGLTAGLLLLGYLEGLQPYFATGDGTHLVLFSDVPGNLGVNGFGLPDYNSQHYTLQGANSKSPWKWMVRRWSFPFGAISAYLQGLLLLVCGGVILHSKHSWLISSGDYTSTNRQVGARFWGAPHDFPSLWQDVFKSFGEKRATWSKHFHIGQPVDWLVPGCPFVDDFLNGNFIKDGIVLVRACNLYPPWK